MVIGAFGDVVFEVSNFNFLTFEDFERTTDANFAVHKVINNTPVLEFTGRDVEEISFTITLHSALGINPAQETEKLRTMVKNGEADFLIISDHAFGENPWVISSLKEKVAYWSPDGKIISSVLDIDLKEYVEFYEE